VDVHAEQVLPLNDAAADAAAAWHLSGTSMA
jgi:hypothetical protein